MLRNTLFLCAALLIPAAAPAQLSDSDLRQVLTDRVDKYNRTVGIVAGLLDEKGSRAISYGKTALENGQPVDGDRVFEIGSVTKTFTATLLADMVVRGEVKLEDPASKYLPKEVRMPSRNGREITLLDLATQTSGLPRLPSNLRIADWSNPYASYTVAQLYEFLSSYTLPRDIGSKYEYSNLGVGLLGHILALRAGKSYEDLIIERVLKPLKMSDTRITLTTSMQARLATGHNASRRPVANWDIPTLAGAGALRSTVNDMLRYAAANAGLVEPPLKPAFDLAHKIQRPAGTPDLEIALCWHIWKKYSTELIWHNGGTGGYHSFVGFLPASRRAVVVLSNSANSIDDIGLHWLVERYPLVNK